MGDLNGIIRQVQSKYVDLTRRDVTAALNTFKDLRPMADNFTFNDGISRPVCALTGTVPVLYKSNTYNIPVCLYLLDTHPYHPPICYVRPTPDMMIKASQHVDTQGRIYLPYLSEWQHPKCDLVGLLQIMVLVFQDSCPVFSRAAAANPAYPGGGASTGYSPYPQHGHGGMPMPHTSTAGGYSYGSQSRLPYPPGSGSTPYPAPVSSHNQPYSYSSPGYPPYSQQSSMTSTSSYPPPGGYSSQGSASSNASTGTIGPEAVRASVVSALEDKLRRRLRDIVGARFAELQSIRKTKEDLDRGQQTLKQMLGRIQSEQEIMTNTAQALRSKNEELDKIIAEAPQAEELKIDEAIDTTAPLYKQLFRCFVEDNTITDTIYYLGEALKRGELDLDSFLKHVRKLSRQQFIMRATMQKCRQKAGLA